MSQCLPVNPHSNHRFCARHGYHGGEPLRFERQGLAAQRRDLIEPATVVGLVTTVSTGDQAGGDQPAQRSVQRAGPQLDVAIGALCGFFGDAVSMSRSVRQREQDVQHGRRQRQNVRASTLITDLTRRRAAPTQD